MKSTGNKDVSGPSVAPSEILQKKEYEQKFVTALGTGQLDIQAYTSPTHPPTSYFAADGLKEAEIFFSRHTS
jgi:hypothetical protein